MVINNEKNAILQNKKGAIMAYYNLLQNGSHNEATRWFFHHKSSTQSTFRTIVYIFKDISIVSS